MKENLGEDITYSDMMGAVLTGIKKSMAIKRVRETTEVLGNLGYSKEEVKDILKGVLKQISCN